MHATIKLNSQEKENQSETGIMNTKHTEASSCSIHILAPTYFGSSVEVHVQCSIK